MRIAAILLALASAGATLGVASPVHAEQDREILVQYEDLNLSATAGRATLDSRIKAAAARVCGPEPSYGLREMASVRACRSAAISEAGTEVPATARAGHLRAAR